MSNTSPTTGIRYGVIAVNSLDSYVSEELFYGPDAVDISYEAAYEEAKEEAKRKYAALLEDCSIAAAESGADREADFDLEDWEEFWFDREGHEQDPEQFVEDELEQFSDICQIEEPNIEGELDGVKYEISWLGGAPILFVLEGPEGIARQLCSPCVPNAADLDGGFVLDSELQGEDDDQFAQQNISAADHDGGYPCYCVPRDWLNQGN